MYAILCAAASKCGKFSPAREERILKLKSVVIRTSDIQKSVSFYENVLGFAFDSMVSASPEKKIAFMTEPESGARLELLHNERAPHPPAAAVSLTFEVDQIADARDYLLSKNVRIIAEPRTIKDGKKIMTAVDPNGVEIDFIEE